MMDTLFIYAAITVVVAFVVIAALATWVAFQVMGPDAALDDLERKHGLRDNE